METVIYEKVGRIAIITLNRPARLNAIDNLMPAEIKICVEQACFDDDVHCIVIKGAGRAFCAGYDLQEFAEGNTNPTGSFSLKNGYDAVHDFQYMHDNTVNFDTLRTCLKPTIAMVHGFAVGGGSDIALSADITIMATTARIGYPPSRIWGIPTTATFAFRVGFENAKRLLFTGKLLNGKEAEEMGLVSEAVLAENLEDHVMQLARSIAAVPKNQLAMSKIVVNSVMERQGILHAQVLSTFFDGIARYSPEGMYFKKKAEREDFKAAIQERDSGEPIAPGVSLKFADRGIRTHIEKDKSKL